jgi:DNA-binding MarR family transcriptional regulator
MPRVGDRRIIDLRLTEEGQRLGRMLPELYSQVLNRSFQKFSPEEIRQLRALLCKLLDEEDIAGAAACARIQEQHHD